MAQPIPPRDPHASGGRVPRTVDGIAGALAGARRMEFYRQLGEATADTAPQVLRRWWCEAELDADPDADRVRRAALNGTLPTSTVAEVTARRRAKGLPVE